MKLSQFLGTKCDFLFFFEKQNAFSFSFKFQSNDLT
jgi:hypothetical protein